MRIPKLTFYTPNIYVHSFKGGKMLTVVLVLKWPRSCYGCDTVGQAWQPPTFYPHFGTFWKNYVAITPWCTTVYRQKCYFVFIYFAFFFVIYFCYWVYLVCPNRNICDIWSGHQLSHTRNFLDKTLNIRMCLGKVWNEGGKTKYEKVYQSRIFLLE